MSFQDSAESWRAKVHISDVKPSVLIVVCIIVLVVAIFLIQNIWHNVQASSFEISSDSSSLSEKSEASEVQDGLSDYSEGQEEALTIFVHVGGAVNNPGVYSFDNGARLQSAIDAAGGFNEDAAQNAVNLARILTDGEQIIVPTTSEYEASGFTYNPESSLVQGKVNINTASVEELMTLPGIGEVTAQKIISDRESKGPFASTEDLKRVSGIGDKKFDQLADSICV